MENMEKVENVENAEGVDNTENAETTETRKSYRDSAIDVRIIKAVEEMGFESMTPIQEQAIPIMLEGKDLIGQAQTGTGKTAAFGIPIIQKIDPEEKGCRRLFFALPGNWLCRRQKKFVALQNICMK